MPKSYKWIGMGWDGWGGRESLKALILRTPPSGAYKVQPGFLLLEYSRRGSLVSFCTAKLCLKFIQLVGSYFTVKSLEYHCLKLNEFILRHILISLCRF